MGRDDAARPFQLLLRGHEGRVDHGDLRGVYAQHAAEPHLLRRPGRGLQPGLVLHAGNTPSSAGGRPAARLCSSTCTRAWSSTVAAPGVSGVRPMSRA